MADGERSLHATNQFFDKLGVSEFSASLPRNFAIKYFHSCLHLLQQLNLREIDFANHWADLFFLSDISWWTKRIKLDVFVKLMSKLRISYISISYFFFDHFFHNSWWLYELFHIIIAHVLRVVSTMDVWHEQMNFYTT